MSEQMRPPTEAELAAAYEEQLRQLRVEDVVVQTIVSLLNLGARKAGLAGGGPEEVDRDQVKLAVDGARALLPLVEEPLGQDAASIRDALSRLQMAYVQLGGQAEEPAAPSGGGAGGPGGGGQGGQGGTGPAQSSGRLWVPGQ
jgi:uncharacterized protein (DUF2236 family)